MKKLILAVAMAACLVPAMALAAEPAKNSSFQYCEKKDQCPFGFETTKNGRKLTDIKLYDKCSPVPVMNWGKIRVKANGKFKKSGTAVDVIGNAIDFTIKGRFKSRKKAVGTYLSESGDCKGKEREFVARRVGKAQPNG